MPKIFIAWMIICLVLGLAGISYTFSKCGGYTFLIGNGGFYAAASGMCDK